jgi:hypothetical protein
MAVSVMMGMRFEVDPDRFTEAMSEEDERLRAIAERAKQMGAIHHMFMASDGEVMVADEWDKEESFHAFFEAAGEDIGVLMQKAGVSNRPEPRFWKPLATSDRF